MFARILKKFTTYLQGSFKRFTFYKGSLKGSSHSCEDHQRILKKIIILARILERILTSSQGSALKKFHYEIRSMIWWQERKNILTKKTQLTRTILVTSPFVTNTASCQTGEEKTLKPACKRILSQAYLHVRILTISCSDEARHERQPSVHPKPQVLAVIISPLWKAYFRE